MQGALAADAVRAIRDHMNADHGDALVAYARAFAGLADASAAVMRSIDALGCDLDVTTPAGERPARIVFDHPLADTADARRTLVALAQRARGEAA